MAGYKYVSSTEGHKTALVDLQKGVGEISPFKVKLKVGKNR